jgi:hypothetical protein
MSGVGQLSTRADQCPLLPQQRHYCSAQRSDAMGHKRTRALHQKRVLVDYLVGDNEHGVRHDQRERLGSSAVDDHLELSWLHDRQIGGLLASQNPGDIGASLAVHVNIIRSVCDQCAVSCGYWKSVDCS